MTKETIPEGKPRVLRVFIIAFSGAMVAIMLAAAVQLIILPNRDQSKSQQKLEALKNTVGPAQPYNKTLIDFKGETVEGTNIEQRALSDGKEATTPARFIFTNGKKNVNKPIKVEVFLDFSSQRSRDLLLMNRNNLTAMVENGTIELEVYPVVTENPFSFYAPEALAESIYTTPDRAWSFMFELMRLSATVDTNSKETATYIEETSKSIGIKDVNSESIKNGTFASWLLTPQTDPRVGSGLILPAIFKNGVEIDTTVVSVNDPEVFRKEIHK
jgi:hypothetical protein